jgi:hypothetical protein
VSQNSVAVQAFRYMETVENVVKDFNYAEVEKQKNASEVLLW